MKTLATALLAIAMIQPAVAETKIPADIHLQPEKFCLVAGVISAGIMERLNVGYPKDYVYAEVNALENPQLRAYLNETVTHASQFASHSSEPIPVKQFAAWNYKRCMLVMTPPPPEVFETVDGKLTKTN